MNSFGAYPSAANGVSPRGAGGQGVSRTRSKKKSRRKAAADDVMMSSMMSGRSDLAGMDTMVSMVSTPGGGRRPVQRAQPSIAVERPDFVENPALKSKREGGCEEEGDSGNSAKPSRGGWFKITGFICCFTGSSKEAHLYGERALQASSRSFYWRACIHHQHLRVDIAYTSCIVDYNPGQTHAMHAMQWGALKCTLSNSPRRLSTRNREKK